MQKSKLVLVLSVTIIIAISFMIIGYLYLNSSPMESNKKILFEIKPGQGFYQVGNELSKKGVVRSLRFFKVLGKLRNASKKIKAGYYKIEGDMSSSELLDLFISGKVFTVKVTIPEGLDNKHIARILEKYNLTDEKDFLEAAKDGQLLKTIGLKSRKTVEGFLFPDTYLIPWGAKPKQIIKMMLANFKRQVGKDIINKMRESKIGLYKSIILASIVEREAVTPHERPVIAGVFLNRNRIGMKFESCATIQYILGEVKKKLYYYHLKINSPYNTYLHRGFPVGPIANPGLQSIRAAAYPQKHKYLYFVSKNDGTHVFSRSGRAHNNAARKYQWNN